MLFFPNIFHRSSPGMVFAGILERAERIADETGVGYQTVLKRAIREGLNKAG
jgi:hypothetical protein